MESISQKIVVACLFCKSLYKVSKTLSGKPVTCTKCRRSFLAAETQLKKPNPEDEWFLLCRLALNYRLINETQLKVVLTEYAALINKGKPISVETLLTSHGGLSDDSYQLLKCIRSNWDLRLADKRFAEEAIEKGFISKEKARQALIRQAQIFHKSRKISLLCDILVESGDLSPSQCDDIFKWKQKPVLSPKPVMQTTPPIPGKNITNTPETAPVEDPTPDIAPVQSKEPQAPPLVSEKKDPQPTSVKSTEPVAEKKAPPHEKKTTPENVSDSPSPPVPVHEREHPEHQESESPIITDPLQTPIKRDPSSAPPNSSESVITDKKGSDQENKTAAPAQTNDPGARVISIQGLELVIAHDDLLATLRVPEGTDPATVPVKDLKAALFEEDIVYGIAEESLIRGFLNSKVFREKPFTIAEGIPPRPGKPGEIRYFFDTDYLKIGAINETGNIDFKNRGEIPYVTEGTLLAEITPAIQGKHGKNIYGQDLPVQDIPDVGLRCENGTELSENKSKVFATVSGQPKLNFGDRIQVLSELTIPGDVGFETGHIDFEGNITIKGTVQPDFTVKGANITAKEVVGATIMASGDLVITDGVTNSTLHVEGNVQAKFIHKCTINAYGNVVSEKEILDCRIENSGACLVERGKIITSVISSRMGVIAKDIGTEMSAPCNIRIGVNDHITRETDIIDEKILKYKVSLAAMEQTLDDLIEQEKELHKQITAFAHIQDRAQIDQNELQKTLERLGQQCPPEKIKEIEQQIAHLAQQAKDADESVGDNFDKQDTIFEERNRINEHIAQIKDRILDLENQKKDKIEWAQKIKGTAYLKTTGSVFNGTVVGGTHCKKTFKETMRNVRMHESKSSETAEGWEMKLI